MKKSSFKHYGLNQATRNTLSVSKFGGVDYSSQKFLVATGRAIDLMNFIYKDGVVQKRNGFEEILKVKEFKYIPADFSNGTAIGIYEIHTNNETGKQINGIWKFVAEDGIEHIVAHIGCLLYEIKNINDKDKISCEPITTGATASVDGEVRELAFEFENFKSFGFVGGNKFWFLGGNKYMLLRFQGGLTEFTAVENSRYTPIPITTMSITYKNAISSGRQSLDNVNLLTKWRKNQLITGVTKAEDEKTKTEFYEYTLDAPLIVENIKDMADVEVTIEESGVID